jgi:hypothetical protein
MYWQASSSRFAPLLEIRQAVLRDLDVSRVPPLVAAAQKQDHLPSDAGAIHAVARAMVDPKLEDASADRLAVTEAPEREP